MAERLSGDSRTCIVVRFCLLPCDYPDRDLESTRNVLVEREKGVLVGVILPHVVTRL